ncbi:MAG TPA: SCO family protein [Acidimicrobiia bacterium]|nr:SCO family protein [Acidimicrobiia bacterium]
MRLDVMLATLACVLVATGCSTATTPVTAEYDESLSQALPTEGIIGRSVGGIALPDVSDGGVPFTLRAEPDGLLIVYFGFTSCPDICPTTLSDVKSALSELGEARDHVTTAMVTVDPERDLDATLDAYLRFFVPDGHALRTGDDALLRAAADAFGADYDVIKASDGNVEVTHTAYLYGVDDTGEIEIVWPFGAEPDRIRSEIEGFLERG